MWHLDQHAPREGVTPKSRGDNEVGQRKGPPALLPEQGVCARGPGAGCLAEGSRSHGLAARSKAEQSSDSPSYGAYFQLIPPWHV